MVKMLNISHKIQRRNAGVHTGQTDGDEVLTAGWPGGVLECPGLPPTLMLP